MRITDAITEKDNNTLCSIRVMGFSGISLVAMAILVGTGAAEVGVGVSAIIAAVGGAIRLKGDGSDSKNTKV